MHLQQLRRQLGHHQDDQSRSLLQRPDHSRHCDHEPRRLYHRWRLADRKRPGQRYWRRRDLRADRQQYQHGGRYPYQRWRRTGPARAHTDRRCNLVRDPVLPGRDGQLAGKRHQRWFRHELRRHRLHAQWHCALQRQCRAACRVPVADRQPGQFLGRKFARQRLPIAYRRCRYDSAHHPDRGIMTMAQTALLRARKLATDSAGFGAMELGLALPFLLLMCLGMIDASNLISTKIDYEQAAQRTTDFALAKRPTNSSTTYLVNEAVNASGLGADDITVELFLECDGVKQSNFNSVCEDGEASGRFVSVEISKDVATRFDWSALSRLIGYKAFNGTVTVTGDSLVRFQ
ncbi:MAG: hypothetical protein EP350_04735 [Alphaproteobacteria bacterium]|nr:MAG: hypothetical protein EP350_04735 [Alphaproteobacteria bacterium]